VIRRSPHTYRKGLARKLDPVANTTRPMERTCPTCGAKPHESCFRVTSGRVNGQETSGGYIKRLKEAHAARKTPQQTEVFVGVTSVSEAKAKMRRRIHNHIVSRGYIGATVEEVAQALGVGTSTTISRVAELRRLGEIHETGRQRPSAKGFPLPVWVATGVSGPLTLIEGDGEDGQPGEAEGGEAA
jgi:hypothetical protein